MTKTALITVGSTKFDDLISQAADISQALSKQGYHSVVIQHGKSRLPEGLPGNVKETFDYTDSLSKYVEQSDLVISHAGTGTIVEVLRGNKTLIAVHNDKLADDHQRELARRLSKLGYCIHSSAENLTDTINTINLPEYTPSKFPEFAAGRVRQFFEREAGFPV